MRALPRRLRADTLWGVGADGDRDLTRGALEVPARFGADRGGVGGASARAHALRLRAAHNALRRLQFEPRVDVVRFLRSGGAAHAAVSAETNEDERLHDLPAEVGRWRQDSEREHEQDRRRDTRTFVLYDVPERHSPSGEACATVLLTDQIRFGGDMYAVVSVDHTPHDGRTVVEARLQLTSSITVGR